MCLWDSMYKSAYLNIFKHIFWYIPIYFDKFWHFSKTNNNMKILIGSKIQILAAAVAVFFNFGFKYKIYIGSSRGSTFKIWPLRHSTLDCLFFFVI